MAPLLVQEPNKRVYTDPLVFPGVWVYTDPLVFPGVWVIWSTVQTNSQNDQNQGFYAKNVTKSRILCQNASKSRFPGCKMHQNQGFQGAECLKIRGF